MSLVVCADARREAMPCVPSVSAADIETDMRLAAVAAAAVEAVDASAAAAILSVAESAAAAAVGTPLTGACCVIKKAWRPSVAVPASVPPAVDTAASPSAIQSSGSTAAPGSIAQASGRKVLVAMLASLQGMALVLQTSSGCQSGLKHSTPGFFPIMRRYQFQCTTYCAHVSILRWTLLPLLLPDTADAASLAALCRAIAAAAV